MQTYPLSLVFFSFSVSSPHIPHHSQAHTSTHTQYPVLEMHGGRLLRRGKPSVNDSSCGKIMFLMQRRLMEGDDFLNG